MQDVKCGCGSNTEWCGMVWRPIRHAEWWSKCSVGCVVWYGMCAVGSVMCILYLNVAMCMVECGHVKWCADTWWSHVIWGELWCDMKCGVMCMWNVVRGGMLHFQTWCDVKCKMCDVEYGVVWTVVPRQLCGMLHNAKCGKLGDVKCGGVELWWLMKNVAYAMCCGCVTSDVENDAMCCDVSCVGVTM